MDAKLKMKTITPFDATVAGVRLRMWRNPYKRVAWLERTGRASNEAAVEVATLWMEGRVKRFLGSGWQVVRGEGW